MPPPPEQLIEIDDPASGLRAFLVIDDPHAPPGGRWDPHPEL